MSVHPLFLAKCSQNRQTKIELDPPPPQTNNKRPFCLPKINKVFLGPILQNLKGRSVLDKFFLKMVLLTTEKDATKQKVLSFQKVNQKRKIVIKIEFTPHSPDRKIFPFKKGFKIFFNTVLNNMYLEPYLLVSDCIGGLLWTQNIKHKHQIPPCTASTPAQLRQDLREFLLNLQL